MSNTDEASKEVKSELIELLRENKAEEAKRLLQKYKNFAFSKDDCGRTAIHWAASGGCLEIVQVCISLRSEDAVSTDDMGWTLLMIASSAGRLHVVRYLITLPLVDVNATNANGQTALHYAASKNHPVLNVLVEHCVYDPTWWLTTEKHRTERAEKYDTEKRRPIDFVDSSEL